MKILIKILILISCILFPVLAKSSAKADNDVSTKNKIILTVATTDDGYYPYNYRENGKRKGLSVDLLNYFEANSHFEFEFVSLPWPRALHLVKNGKIDLILTLFKTKPREQYYHFIEPYYAYEANQLFVLADNNFEFTGQLKQLTPFSIGTVRDYSYGEDFDNAAYLKKYQVLTEKTLLKQLLSKRSDMLISNPLIFKNIIAEQKATTKVKAVEPYVSLTPVYLALAKNRENSEEITKTLSQLTRQLKASPYYQDLLIKHKVNFK